MQPLVNPSELMVDFEIAIHRAFTSVFPNCSIVGCLFHLGQSLYQKTTDLVLRGKYKSESDFCLKVRCFSALAFLSVADVEEAYEELTDDDEIPGEFISYFGVNYMGVVRGHGRRRRREPPLFPMELWNVNNRIVNNLPRTNNALEGYHSSLKLGATHPNIWRLIKSLENETGLIQTKITHIHRGDIQ
ncbi:uncharacterized protein [Macrobrachium rosenbergii]|uniref:uncharacterized protein n=1 Tax=Macrobrachium rosenbergii TaxID=79674 RepID=UPI0034D49A61